MIDKDRLMTIRDGNHAYVFAHHNRDYGHVEMRVQVLDESGQIVQGVLVLSCQIGTEDEASIRGQLRSNVYSYAHRWQIEAPVGRSRGATSASLMTIAKKLAKVEKATEQYLEGTNYADMTFGARCAVALGALKTDAIILEDEVRKPGTYTPHLTTAASELNPARKLHLSELRNRIEAFEKEMFEAVVSRTLRLAATTAIHEEKLAELA